MADEHDDSQKTEQPSQKRLQEAEERGDVTQSPDVAAWLVLAAATAFLVLWSPVTAASLRKMLTGFLSTPHAMTLSADTATGIASSIGYQVLSILSVPFGILVVVAVGSHLIQHPPVFALEKLKPDSNHDQDAEGHTQN